MAEGENAAQVALQRAVDLRYAGQSSELTLPIVEGDIGQPQFFHTLGERFAADHERTYGHRAPDDPIEVVNLRLTAIIPTAKSQFSYLQPPSSQTLPPNRRCYFGRETGWLEVPVLSREGLGSNLKMDRSLLKSMTQQFWCHHVVRHCGMNGGM